MDDFNEFGSSINSSAKMLEKLCEALASDESAFYI